MRDLDIDGRIVLNVSYNWMVGGGGANGIALAQVMDKKRDLVKAILNLRIL